MSRKLHNIRLYTPKPRAIFSLSVNEEKHKLAVCRDQGIIEIWNIQHAPFIERSIPSNPSYNAIENLIWCKDRLFSCGREGFLVEYDLKALTRLKCVSVTGGAAYCIDTDPTHTNLAIGTDNGYLNIFSVEDDDVVFSKFLDKQEGKILCLKYDPSGKYIASGSIDTIRLWDVETGHALHRMTTGRAENNKTTIVWSIAITEDLTIISGDSRGKLTFWDGKVGAQIESYQSHKADILTVCLSKDEKTLYSAGVDPNIMSYERIQVKDQKNKWVKSIQRKIHENDVRALVLVDNKLYSAGEDAYLACSYHPPKTLLKYAPFIQNPIELCEKNRLILMKEPFSLNIWTLGLPKENQSENESYLPDRPKRLISITNFGSNDEENDYIFVTLSENGQFLIGSTDTKFTAYHLTIEKLLQKQGKGIRKVAKAAEIPVCVNGVFINSDHAVVAPRPGGLKILKIEENDILTIQDIDTSKVLKDTVTILHVSPCKNFIVAADPESNIGVWKLFNSSFKFHCQLPKYKCPPTALAVNSKTHCLVVTYSDQKIVEFSVNKQKFSEFSRQLGQINIKKFSKSYPVKNILFSDADDDLIYIHDDTNVLVIDKTMKKHTQKKAKINEVDSGYDAAKHSIKLVKKYQHLVHLGYVAQDEVVAVEVTPLSFSKQLPPRLEQSLFGTK